MAAPKMTLGTTSGNREVLEIWIGTTSGNNIALEAHVGTTSGNRLFHDVGLEPPEDPVDPFGPGGFL